MKERHTFTLFGSGTNEMPYHIEGDIEDGLISIVQHVTKRVAAGEQIEIDTPAGILGVRMRKVGNGRGQTVFEAIPGLTSRQDAMVRFASIITSLFTTQYTAEQIMLRGQEVITRE